MDNLGLFDAITDSAVLLDKTARIVGWNNGATTLFGYSKKEVLGRSINFLYDHHYPFSKLIHEQKKWQDETSFVHKNGTKGMCQSSLSFLPPHDEYKNLSLLLHHKISDYIKSEKSQQKAYDSLLEQLGHSQTNLLSAKIILLNGVNHLEQTERKLRESELRFRLLAENATDVISRHTPDGFYLYVSPASLLSIGYSAEDLVGKNIFKLIHHDDIAKMKKAFTRRRENASNKPIDYRIKHKEGEFRWFESNIRLIMDEQTRIISEIQLSSRDITNRVLDKKARLRGQQLAHVFRLSTMEEMASGIAHEISQPLAAIVNYTRGCVRHLQNEEHDRDQIKQVMEKAVAQAERAGEIVQRLKNFFCKGQLLKTTCKMHNVVRETISLMKNELNSSKTKVDFEFDKTIPFIFMDKIQIQQVLLNLMQNAIEAMQERHIKEKRIHIHTKAIHGNMVEITIQDTGPGFSKEHIQKVFMPFFTTKAHGRGMGLAICRSIIEAHGGEFTIHPNVNGNSWIRFSLPISI